MPTAKATSLPPRLAGAEGIAVTDMGDAGSSCAAAHAARAGAWGAKLARGSKSAKSLLRGDKPSPSGRVDFLDPDVRKWRDPYSPPPEFREQSAKLISDAAAALFGGKRFASTAGVGP